MKAAEKLAGEWLRREIGWMSGTLCALFYIINPTYVRVCVCDVGYLSYTMTFFNVSEFYCCKLGHCCWQLTSFFLQLTERHGCFSSSAAAAAVTGATTATATLPLLLSFLLHFYCCCCYGCCPELLLLFLLFCLEMLTTVLPLLP